MSERWSTKRLDVRPGEKFGQLEIVREAAPNSRGGRYFWCRCSCGKEARVFMGHLRDGSSQSCGCAPRHPKVVLSEKNFRFGPMLAKITRRHGLTYTDVARKMGARPHTITNYVYNMGRPGPPIITFMADAIGATKEERRELHLAAARDRGYQV